MKKLLSITFSFLLITLSAEQHQFQGDHLFATYYECDEQALNDLAKLESVMKDAVLATGAKILNSISHAFDPEGFSMIILVSESHASIHTYPEYHSCFVDIFTCGDCDVNQFDHVLQNYLNPKKVMVKHILRD